MSQELWKTHPIFNVLLISNKGRVYFKTRKVNSPRCLRTVKGRIIKQYPDEDGRPTITFSIRNKTYARHVCRLVLETWVGLCPDGMECCHFPDRDPANNCLKNLRWDTTKSNMADKRLHGTHLEGADIPWAKLSDPERQVGEIHDMYNSGATQEEVGAAFGLDRRSVQNILAGKTYVASQPPETERAVGRVGKAQGEKNHHAKLTEKDIPAIRSAYDGGESISSIARRYGMSRYAIAMIAHRKHWKHVT